MTGPIIFSDETARNQLVNHGEVITFRKSERTTGETWWRKTRLGEKEGDVTVELEKVVEPCENGLEQYVDLSGFDSVSEWQNAICELNGELPDRGYLYRVVNVNFNGKVSNEVNIKRLGQQQKDILRFMYNGFVCQQVDIIKSLHRNVTNSRKASVSRTIKQLREYNLIKEVEKNRPHYTITDLGKRFVEVDDRFDISSENEYSYEYRQISIDKLRIDRYNMRSTISCSGSLIESIEENGLIQPLIVRQTPGEFGYSIIDGSRRFDALSHIFYHGDTNRDKFECRILYGVSDSEALEIFYTLNVNWDNREKTALDY